MRKIGISIFVIFLFFISTQVHTQGEHIIKWTEREPADTVNYSKSYTYGNCLVSVFEDKSGVNINTISGIYVQDIIISRCADGTILKFEEYHKKTILENGNETYVLCEDSRDIFRDKYLTAAKHLPEEVKKLFFEVYGF